MIRQLLVSTLIGLPILTLATELAPWFSPNYEIQTKASVLFQDYKRVETPHGPIHEEANDRFFIFSAGGAACIPINGVLDSFCGLAAELEMTVADTHHQHPAIDNFRLTARYQLLDDVADEDPVSLVAGATVTQAFRHSLHDISSFHHGQIEGEVHLSVGKEFASEQYWQSRIWSVLGVGMGDIGNVWLRGDLNWEYNWCNQHQLQIFTHSLWGTGGNNISHYKSFRGYGPIAHQSIDLGARYTYLFCNYSTLSFEYGRRLYARNFPEHANLFLLSFMYPFSL